MGHLHSILDQRLLWALIIYCALLHSRQTTQDHIRISHPLAGIPPVITVNNLFNGALKYCSADKNCVDFCIILLFLVNIDALVRISQLQIIFYNSTFRLFYEIKKETCQKSSYALSH